MRFFKKLFSFGTSSEENNCKSLELLLNSINFSQQQPPRSFYDELYDIHTFRVFDKEDVMHIKASMELKETIYRLAEKYNQMIVCGFTEKTMNAFSSLFFDLSEKKYLFPGINNLLCTYWYQPIRKTREDIKKSNNKEQIFYFEEFHAKIRGFIEERLQVSASSVN